MCQINPVTYDEATGSVDEGSAADTISLSLADKKAQTRLMKKWLVWQSQDSSKEVKV